MKTPRFCRRPAAFTLIELLVVIAIIAVLMGLAFPAFQSVQNSAKRTQAKNDLTQIVTAVNAFYTEYGRYPSDDTPEADFGPSDNERLFNELRGDLSAQPAPTLNVRNIAFITPPEAKDGALPKGGLGQTDRRWYDPWGKPYYIRLDTNYDGKVGNPYSSSAGPPTPNFTQPAIAWSLGKDGAGGMGDKNASPAKDDVLSWQ